MEADKKFERFLSSDELDGTEWIGEVVDNNDPDHLGRCRVRVFGKFDGRKDPDDSTSDFSIPDDQIPWANPIGSSVFGGGDKQGAGSLSVPKKGAKVKVRFSGGNIYEPEYYALQDLNEKLVDEIKDSYENAHVLLFDEDENLKIVYTKDKGLEIWLKESHLLINPDSSITFEHKDSQSIIELVGSNCNITTKSKVTITANDKIEATAPECVINGNSKTQLGPTGNFSAVGAEPLWVFLTQMATALDLKWPPSPGVNAAAAQAAEKASTSKIVKVSVP